MPHFANRNGTHTVLGWAIPGGWVGGESVESRSAQQSYRSIGDPRTGPHFCHCRQMN